jgi:hypothetical protein
MFFVFFKVISNLEYFTDIGLKQHLEYALHNVITSTNEITKSFKQSITKSNKKKVRKISEKLAKRNIKSGLNYF